MGDIFWDFDASRAPKLGHTDPHEVAAKAIEQLLRQVAPQTEENTMYPMVLRSEYAAIVAEVRDPDDDGALTRALVSDAAWTDGGAREIVSLARRYGTFGLRNALALAEALGIEDGSSGL
jgi:hypothetical protein